MENFQPTMAVLAIASVSLCAAFLSINLYVLHRIRKNRAAEYNRGILLQKAQLSAKQNPPPAPVSNLHLIGQGVVVGSGAVPLHQHSTIETGKYAKASKEKKGAGKKAAGQN